MTYCRTILGLSKDLFDWRFQLNRDFNFAGGLTANLNKLFENRAKMHGSLYDSGAGREIQKNVRRSKDLRIDILDKNDPKEHQMKVCAIIGAFFGFCGGTEHANSLVEHLEVGVFEVGHELEVSDFYGLAPKEDKTTKLTTTNTIFARSEYTHIPIGDKTRPLLGALSIVIFRSFLRD